MTDDFSSPCVSPASFPTGVGCAVWCMLLVAAPAALCRAQIAPEKTLPKVLMVAFQGSTPDDAGLYKALRAQLSASPLTLDRIERPRKFVAERDSLKEAAGLASAHHAAMVFWIEDEEICRMFFFIPDGGGGRINSRDLDLDLSSRPSRFEVIAVVAAGMIEGLLASHTREAPLPNPAQNAAGPIIPPKEAGVKSRNRFEFFAAYSGSFFASGSVTHGVLSGLGFFPIAPLALAISFTQGLPIRLETDAVQFAILARQLEVTAAGRLSTHPIDLRIGVSWSADLRSYSTASVSETIGARGDGFTAVYSLVPFVSAAWVFSERIGLFGRVGVNLALNETIYKINQDEVDTLVLEPFIAKLMYQFGLVVQI